LANQEQEKKAKAIEVELVEIAKKHEESLEIEYQEILKSMMSGTFAGKDFDERLNILKNPSKPDLKNTTAENLEQKTLGLKKLNRNLRALLMEANISLHTIKNSDKLDESRKVQMDQLVDEFTTKQGEVGSFLDEFLNKNLKFKDLTEEFFSSLQELFLDVRRIYLKIDKIFDQDDSKPNLQSEQNQVLNKLETYILFFEEIIS
jgi:hypothetical protein